MSNTNEPWTKEEDNALFALYPSAPQTEIMQALPRFSWYRIYDRAKAFEMRRVFPRQGCVRVNMYHRTMTWQDLEAVAGLVTELEEKERLQEIANVLARETLRGELSAHWWLSFNGMRYID